MSRHAPLTPVIEIKKASSHNLKGVDLAIPHNRLVVVTGVSGSGKSSLAFDTVCIEGQRRYLESFSSRARQLLGKLGQPEVGSVSNLGPAIAIDQKTAVRNPRSTVGTMSELYDHLRLLYARLGQQAAGARPGEPLRRSLFSFNSDGACPACRGLGVVERIDQDLLIADPERTLREGALAITTDSGYIIYSQVTMDVLDQVCAAHGFSVDIPWREMTEEQRQVILYGSDRIEIPFGKHPLESRLKWSGITARPRQQGFYGGIVPVMEQILRRNRNRNILRFVSSGPCTGCQGTRLCETALAVRFQGLNIAEMAALSLADLDRLFRAMEFVADQAAVGSVIREEITKRTALLLELGLSYLTLDREAPSLAGGEAQRIRLASIVGSGLRGMTYVLDEPSVGLHPRDIKRLLHVLRRLVDQGNSVLVVEHDQQTMLAADWLIDIGPGAGVNGGEVLFSGPPAELLADSNEPTLLASRTRAFLRGDSQVTVSSPRRVGKGKLSLRGANRFNLRNINVDFLGSAFNVISGVSGAGKSSLLAELAAQVRQDLISHRGSVNKLISIDQKPIGQTPRSNPATYTGLYDPIRALFAAQPTAREKGLGKGQFSFNNQGGRCASCQGAGVERIGMHFLGDVEITCSACAGRRFSSSILTVEYQGRNISQVLEMSVAEAAELFADQPRLARYLGAMNELGLGYLALGQCSTTLSGGEAQRIKLAAELARPRSAGTLYILDEPTTGLHPADVKILLQALGGLVDGGSTVVATEHDLDFIQAADQVIDLGPQGGEQGGRVLWAGPPEGLAGVSESATGQALNQAHSVPSAGRNFCTRALTTPIRLSEVRTHNLKGINVEIPVNRITVITGVSGSGKSSLAQDTLLAEGRSRYAENFSTYIRQMLTGRTRADVASCHGLSPTIAISQRAAARNPRSTVATVAEIHALLRLLLSRGGSGFPGQRPRASLFSFNSQDGACPGCRGLGLVTVCDPEKLVSDPQRSLLDGALDGHKTGRFYGDRDGQYVATLRQVGRELGIDFSVPYHDLDDSAREVAFAGTGEREFSVLWRFKRGRREGEHGFVTTWPGLAGHIQAEYQKKHADRRGRAMLTVMKEVPCPDCQGHRLRAEALAVRFADRSIVDLCAQSVAESIDFFANLSGQGQGENRPRVALGQIFAEILLRLRTLRDVGLEYVTLDRRSSTLSGGEAQRLRLARQLGASLRGVTYVLDEPTLGLHAKDISRLWKVITRLRDQGNTLVVVEHDGQVIMAADHVIDLGPGAGRQGGEIVVQGPPAAIMANQQSLTGQYLRRWDLTSTSPVQVRKPGAGKGNPVIAIRGACCNNLDAIDIDFATACLTAITGVSGSGKSSLLFGTIAESAERGRAVECRQIHGLESFAAVVPIRQRRAPTAVASTPATLSGVFDPIRCLLAATDSAKSAGLSRKFFSPSQRGGRCEKCQGTGSLRVSMDFLADVTTICPDCQGQRFARPVLDCRFQGLNVTEILDLDIAAAAIFFAANPEIAAPLQLLVEIGLDYLKLGQPVPTLSGGEGQRLHLASALQKGGKGSNLYLCDEPTAGLHGADIDRLWRLFERLTNAGHTVIVAEHDRELIARAHRVIELGPGAGRHGGKVIS